MEFLDHPIAMILVGILSFPVYKTLAKVFSVITTKTWLSLSSILQRQTGIRCLKESFGRIGMPQ